MEMTWRVECPPRVGVGGVGGVKCTPRLVFYVKVHDHIIWVKLMSWCKVQALPDGIWSHCNGTYGLRADKQP